MQASSAGGRGDLATKSKYDKISIVLTVSAIVFQVVGFIVIIGTVLGIVLAPAAVVRTVVSNVPSCSSRFGCFG